MRKTPAILIARKLLETHTDFLSEIKLTIYEPTKYKQFTAISLNDVVVAAVTCF